MKGIPRTLRPVLETYARRLRAVFGGRLRDVRLFGSCARGDANEDSDVDVLVVIDALTDQEMVVVLDEGARLRMECRVPLSPLPMATDQLGELRRQGRLLARELDADGVSL